MSSVVATAHGFTRSNSFNLVPVRDVPRASGQGCPLRAEPEHPIRLLAETARDRALFLRLSDRMRLFATTTRDFSELEVARVKNVTGQLYADVSHKIAPDDFGRDLIKLELCRECTDCEHRSRCAGCYRASNRDVFARDDARARAIVRELRGRVLDVGCGEAPYLSELDPQRVEYLGIDPDPDRIALLSERHPWARFRVAALSELSPDASFDHVLVLRSYNHLRDPLRELSPIVEHIVEGGSLLVVDNVAFGLVRSREHALRSEHAGAGFEHFRNDSATDAERLLADLGLTLGERSEVGPETSNQWLLHYWKRQP